MLKFIFLLFFISSCTSFNSKVSTKKAALYEKIGISFLQQNNYPSALSRLLRAEKLNKKSASIQNYLGLAYFALKKYKRSTAHFKKSIQLNPKPTEYKNNLAYSLIRSQKYKIALGILKKNLQDLTYPLQHKTYFYLSLIQTEKNNLRLAKKFIIKSLALNNTFCPSKLQFAKILHQDHKYKASNRQLLISFSSCPGYKNSQNLFMQATNYYKTKKYIKAFAIFQILSKGNSSLTGQIKKFLNPADTH